jgi:hypothetical protein
LRRALGYGMGMHPAVFAIALLAVAPFALVALVAVAVGAAMSPIVRVIRVAVQIYRGRL